MNEEKITNMARTHLHFRTWVGLFVLIGLIFVFLRAGLWQLDRAHTRDSNAIAIQEAQDKPQLPFKDIMEALASHPQADAFYWRQAHVEGRWLHQFTLFIDNRNHNGVPGFWVATPLQTGTDEAVLVLRGWLPRDHVLEPTSPQETVQTSLLNTLSAEHSTVAIQGEVYPHVPRVFELWRWAGGQKTPLKTLLDHDSTPAIVSNLSLNELDNALPVTLAPVAVAQTSTSRTLPDMVQDWPHPSSDADTNRGYALQWFSFSAIAAVISLAWLIKLWRRSHQQKDTR